MSEERYIYDGLDDGQCEKFGRFAEILQEENAKFNLTRVVDTQDVYRRHFDDSLAALEMIEDKDGLRLADVGSGAGFPGLAIAIAKPGWDVTSIEATGKKVGFQQKVIDELGLENAAAVQGRGEAVARKVDYREQFDVVTARALAGLPVLVELVMPLVKVGGVMLAWKGSKAREEVAQAKEAIKQLGGKLIDVHKYEIEDQGSDVGMVIVKVEKVNPSPRKFPRVYGMIKKTPILG